MKLTLLFVFGLNLILKAQDNVYSFIDTTTIYVGIKDTVYVVTEKGNDSIVPRAYMYMRFFSNNKFFISQYLNSIQYPESFNKEYGAFGKYKIKNFKEGKIKIQYIDKNEHKAYGIRNKRFLIYLKKDKLIFSKYASGSGLIFFWKRIKSNESENVYYKQKI